MRTRSLALVAAALLAAPLEAAAEAALVRGEAKTLGWPVYDESGKLGFAACDGASQPLGEAGSFVAAEERCPSPPSPFTLTGKVSAIVPEKSSLELTDGSGRVHRLYLSAEAATALAELTPDATIRVEGPVVGHAAAVSPASQ